MATLSDRFKPGFLKVRDIVKAAQSRQPLEDALVKNLRELKAHADEIILAIHESNAALGHLREISVSELDAAFNVAQIATVAVNMDEIYRLDKSEMEKHILLANEPVLAYGLSLMLEKISTEELGRLLAQASPDVLGKLYQAVDEAWEQGQDES